MLCCCPNQGAFHYACCRIGSPSYRSGGKPRKSCFQTLDQRAPLEPDHLAPLCGTVQTVHNFHEQQGVQVGNLFSLCNSDEIQFTRVVATGIRSNNHRSICSILTELALADSISRQLRKLCCGVHTVTASGPKPPQPASLRVMLNCRSVKKTLEVTRKNSGSARKI